MAWWAHGILVANKRKYRGQRCMISSLKSRLPHLPVDKGNKLLVTFGAKVRRTIDALEKQSKFRNVL